MLENRGPVWRHAPAAVGTTLLVAAAVVGTQVALAGAGHARAPLSPYGEGGFTVGVAAVDRRVSITAADDGSYVLGYTPAGGDVVLDMDLLSGDTVQPWWYDPQTGRTLKMRTLTSEGVARFPVPKQGGGPAWVLVVDDVAAGYGPPDKDVVAQATGKGGPSGATGSPASTGGSGTGSSGGGTGAGGTGSSGSSGSGGSGSSGSGASGSSGTGSGGSGSGSSGQGGGSGSGGTDSSSGGPNSGSGSSGGGSGSGSGSTSGSGDSSGSSSGGGSGSGSTGSGADTGKGGSGSGGSSDSGSGTGGSGANGGSGSGESSGSDGSSDAEKGSNGDGADKGGSGATPSGKGGSGKDGSGDQGRSGGGADENGGDKSGAEPGTDPASGSAPEDGKFGKKDQPAPEPVKVEKKANPSPATQKAAADPSWDKLATCESSGDWGINTGNGYYGGLQFDTGTWSDFGGTKYAPRPDKATKEQQIEIASKVRDARGGYSSWPACSSKLGLPK